MKLLTWNLGRGYNMPTGTEPHGLGDRWPSHQEKRNSYAEMAKSFLLAQSADILFLQEMPCEARSSVHQLGYKALAEKPYLNGWMGVYSKTTSGGAVEPSEVETSKGNFNPWVSVCLECVRYTCVHLNNIAKGEVYGFTEDEKKAAIDAIAKLNESSTHIIGGDWNDTFTCWQEKGNQLGVRDIFQPLKKHHQFCACKDDKWAYFLIKPRLDPVTPTTDTSLKRPYYKVGKSKYNYGEASNPGSPKLPDAHDAVLVELTLKIIPI